MRMAPATLKLLRRQLGVISRRQLFAQTYTRAQIDGLLRHGQLEPAARAVYRRPGSPRGQAQEALIAVLRCRVPARVYGSLLLALLGCEGHEVEESTFTLLVPPGHRIAQAPFRWRTDPAPELHAATHGAVPGVTPARNILELATDLTDEALLLAADRLRWRTRTGTVELTHVAAAVPEHPGVGRLAALGLLDGGRPESPGERGLHPVLEALPFRIEWQVWVAPDLRVDALIREAGIVIEYDGPTHGDARDRLADAARDRRLEALGYLVVHVTAADLRHPEALRRRLTQLCDARLT